MGRKKKYKKVEEKKSLRFFFKDREWEIIQRYFALQKRRWRKKQEV